MRRLNVLPALLGVCIMLLGYCYACNMQPLHVGNVPKPFPSSVDLQDSLKMQQRYGIACMPIARYPKQSIPAFVLAMQKGTLIALPFAKAWEMAESGMIEVLQLCDYRE